MGYGVGGWIKNATKGYRGIMTSSRKGGWDVRHASCAQVISYSSVSSQQCSKLSYALALVRKSLKCVHFPRLAILHWFVQFKWWIPIDPNTLSDLRSSDYRPQLLLREASNSIELLEYWLFWYESPTTALRWLGNFYIGKKIFRTLPYAFYVPLTDEEKDRK